MVKSHTFPPIKGYPCYVDNCEYIGGGRNGYTQLQYHLKNNHRGAAYPSILDYFNMICGFKYHYKWEAIIQREERHRYSEKQKASFNVKPKQLNCYQVCPFPKCNVMSGNQKNLRNHLRKHIGQGPEGSVEFES
jgi:hypothetical protein